MIKSIVLNGGRVYLYVTLNIKKTMMYRLKLVVLIVTLKIAGYAQIIDIKKTAENAILSQTNQTINTGINKGVNAVFQGPGKIYQKIKQNRQTSRGAVSNNPAINNSNNSDYNNASPAPVKSSYGTDFTPGNNMIFMDDFSNNEVGKFPGSWTTNSLGEVRFVDGQTGKWLQLSRDGIFCPEALKGLPGNFTLEYDAIFSPASEKEVHYILYVYSVKDKISDFKETNYPGNGGIYFAFNVNDGEVDAESYENGRAGALDLHLVSDVLRSSVTNKVHVAIEKGGMKVSLYLNGHKVFSSSNPIDHYDTIKFGSFYMGDKDFMLISNLKIAAN